MRKTLYVAALAAMVSLVCAAQAAQPAKKKGTTPAKKSVAAHATASKSASAHKPATTASSRKTTGRTTATRTTTTRTTATASRTKKAPATTWRNRQMSPSPERYKEIQDALVSKGFLRSEDASGGWNSASLDALKKFQAAQNLDPSGKINSLSLIALGLGPKRESTASVKPPTPPAAPVVNPEPPTEVPGGSR